MSHHVMSTARRIAFPAETLEEELAGVLHDANVRGRQARAVAARLGWDGGGPRTLAAAAAGEGYSRERVRQLEERVRVHVRSRRTPMTATETALRLIAEVTPINAREAEARLASAGLTRGRFRFQGLLTAAEMLGVAHDVRELEGVLLREDLSDVSLGATHLARRLVRRYGATRFQELTLRLGGGWEPTTVRRLLEASPSVSWLDDRRGWFVIGDLSTCATRTLRKMLAVSDALTVTDLDLGLRRSRQPVVLPLDVVRLVCSAQSWLAVDHSSDSVRARGSADLSHSLSALERALVAIFREHGPTMTFSQVVEIGVASGLNAQSVGTYLTHTPVVRTLSRGRYTLCGSGRPGTTLSKPTPPAPVRSGLMVRAAGG